MSEGRQFERAALPLLRLIWGETIGTPALRSFDVSGIDHLVWSDTQPFPLVVQCKGFQAQEHEIGSSHVNQCLKSIRSFQKSCIRADRYLIVHNRDGRNEAFRTAVRQALDDLVASGQVRKAELWDRQTLVRRAFDTMSGRVRDAFARGSLQLAHQFSGRMRTTYDPIKVVPLRISYLDTDQWGVRSVDEGERELASPAAKLVDEETKLTILTGEAGLGKTTATSIAYEMTKKQLFYVPAAIISKDSISTRDVLTQCVDLSSVYRTSDPQDNDTLRDLARAAVGRLFLAMHPKTEAFLILDGIDESVFFTRRQGIQWLINLFREVQTPIVFTVRSELWNERWDDFVTAAGFMDKKARSKTTRIRHIELLKWCDEEIIELAERFHDAVEHRDEKMRIHNFIAMVRKGDYQEFYKDIPRTPLFLDWILETVAEHGVHPVGRGKLFLEYAERKIKRDIFESLDKGGPGRLGIIDKDEGSGAVIDLSFALMTDAAGLMADMYEGAVELLPDCRFEQLTSIDARYQNVYLAGLALNSLLISAKRERARPARLKFTHRAFQEIFFGRYLLLHPHRFEGATVPREVSEWVEELREFVT